MKISFDAVVNLIIMLIVIWSFISKLRKKSSPEPDEKSVKPQGIRQIIGEIVNNLSEIDSGKREPISKHNRWERVISEEPLQEADFELDEMIEVPPPLPSAKEQVKKDMPATEIKIPATSVQQNNMLTLRQAVIWSEILAPPVSLRDK